MSLAAAHAKLPPQTKITWTATNPDGRKVASGAGFLGEEVAELTKTGGSRATRYEAVIDALCNGDSSAIQTKDKRISELEAQLKAAEIKHALTEKLRELKTLCGLLALTSLVSSALESISATGKEDGDKKDGEDASKKSAETEPAETKPAAIEGNIESLPPFLRSFIGSLPEGVTVKGFSVICNCDECVANRKREDEAAAATKKSSSSGSGSGPSKSPLPPFDETAADDAASLEAPAETASGDPKTAAEAGEKSGDSESDSE